MRKATLTKIAARVAATIAVIVALGATAGGTAASAEAASCGVVNGVQYCYTGSSEYGSMYSHIYSTNVFANGSRGTLVRMQWWNGYSWSLYGCYQTNPGFSGYVRCPF